jgi:hypothetical protein
MGLAAVSAPVGHAQVRPKADTAAIVEYETVRAGSSARVALQVSLPETFHIQSNKPRDPSLIATELTIDAPAGVTVEEVVFPAATDLKQEGADQPLAVFPSTSAFGSRSPAWSRRSRRPLHLSAGLRRSPVLSAGHSQCAGRFTSYRRMRRWSAGCARSSTR